MVTLSDQDVSELLRYTASDRHPLEILGYASSTRGARQFRQDRPDFVPQVCQLIRTSLEKTGSFPREPSEGILQDGTYLKRGPEDLISRHTSLEIRVSQTARIHFEFTSVPDAVVAMFRRVGDPAHLLLSP